MKNDTAHYDASTVLSTLNMLSTEMNILVHPPKNHFIFGHLFLDRILYWLPRTSAERSLQGKGQVEHKLKRIKSEVIHIVFV